MVCGVGGQEIGLPVARGHPQAHIHELRLLRTDDDEAVTQQEILLAAGRLDRESLMQLAAERFAACMLSDEGREGIAAFIEKRKPTWAA